MANIDLGKVALVWKGEYDNLCDYEELDIVYFQNSSFICKKDTKGNNPLNKNYWDLFVSGVPYLTKKGGIIFHGKEHPEILSIGKEDELLKVHAGIIRWGRNEVRKNVEVAQLQSGVLYGQGVFICYLMKSGTIKVFGNGSGGCTGLIGNKATFSPIDIGIETENPPNTPFIKIFAGHHCGYALTEDGYVYSWGNNGYGNLGHGDTLNRSSAKRIDWFFENGIRIKDIAMASNIRWGYNTTYFITIDGDVYACGANAVGQIGDGTTAQKNIPTRCGQLTNIKQIFVSNDWCTSTYAIDENGDLYSWGFNGQGQLGHGNITNLSTPKKVDGISKVKKGVATGGNWTHTGDNPYGYALIFMENGEVYGAGQNGEGQLGLGDTANKSIFTLLSGNFTNVKDIITGGGVYGSSGLITESNDLFLWGYNSYGQLGLKDTTQRTSPNKPSGDFQGKVKKVIIGGQYTYNFIVVLTRDGELWGAGYGTHGQLARGFDYSAINSTFKRFSTPLLKNSPKIVDFIISGHDQSSSVYALLESGEVLACGRDGTDWGILGIFPYAPTSATTMNFVNF